MAIFGSLNAEAYDRQYDDRYLVQRIASYFRPHSRLVWIVLVMIVLVSASSSAVPVLIAIGIDAVQHSAQAYLIPVVVGALLVSVVVAYIAYWVRRRLTARLIADVVSQMRKDAFAAAVYRDLGFYDETKSGKVVSRITSDTQEFNQIALIMIDLFGQVIEVIVLFFVLINREWRLTLLVIAMMPVLVGIALLFRRWARVVTRQGSRAMAAVNDNIQESVTGISVAKNFRREAMIYDEFVEINQQSYRINLRRGLVLAMIFPALNAASGLGIGTMVYVGATAVIGGVIQAGSWYLFIQSLDRFFFPFINLAAFWSQVQQGLSAVERIFALIDAENVVKQTDHQPVKPLRGLIEFQDVVFDYKPLTNGAAPAVAESDAEQSILVYKSGKSVLDRFSLTIQPGESVAFVGHTGAGKSTIAKLIARFYEFQDGQILIDGQNIRTFDIQTYRRQLGIVPQAPFLFSGTILDNIRYARPEATDAEIEAIAYSIGGGEWLETVPQGLLSDVGERGAHLSMGQRQLVSLLRVLVQKPAIFILDEATASIDPFTETQIQEALEMILKQSTSILIAHRLSTVRRADRIVVLKSGSIIEEGNHDFLMRQGGHYAELYNTYFRHQSLNYIEQAKTMFDSQELKQIQARG